MNAKKWFVFLLALLLLLPVLRMPAAAAKDPEFRFELTVDGKDAVEARPGDVLTVTLHLYRTDRNADFTMYAMQDEIRYESSFFKLVKGSELLADGIQSTDLAVEDGMREFYMNFVSFTGGKTWASKTRVGSFQLRVTGNSGVHTITNEDFLVSLPDGSGSYQCEANELTIILSRDCTVTFDTGGGSEIEPMDVLYGEILPRPETPVREGMRLVGWYKDITLTQKWNFRTDTVKGNITLYAKWEPLVPVVDEPDDSTTPTFPTYPAPTDPVDPGFPWDPSGFEIPKEVIYILLAIPVIGILVAVVLLLLRLLPLLLAYRRDALRYSLVTGDIVLDYTEEERSCAVEIILCDGDRRYSLGKSHWLEPGENLTRITNPTGRSELKLSPGLYQGKISVNGKNWCRITECRIRVIDDEKID